MSSYRDFVSYLIALPSKSMQRVAALLKNVLPTGVMASFTAKKSKQSSKVAESDSMAGKGQGNGGGKGLSKMRKMSVSDDDLPHEVNVQSKKARKDHDTVIKPGDIFKSIEDPDPTLLAECKRINSTRTVEFVRHDMLEKGRGYVNVWRKDGEDCMERTLAEILEVEEVDEDRVALRLKVHFGKGSWVILAGTVHTELNHGRFAEEEMFPKTLKLH